MISLERVLDLRDKGILGIQTFGVEDQRFETGSAGRSQAVVGIAACDGKRVGVGNDDARQIAKQLGEDICHAMPRAWGNDQFPRIARTAESGLHQQLIFRHSHSNRRR
jgi:hypothetical protein